MNPQLLQISHPRFLTLEGIEGVGKSTLTQYVADWLRAAGCAVIQTREPGGTSTGEKIRKILLEKSDEPLSDMTELLLMFAARAQHLQQIIYPALKRGEWVVCDRFTDASYAYQGAGRGIDHHKIALLEQCVQDGFQPDLTLLLDLPENEAFARTAQRGNQPDRFESEALNFFARIRHCYLERAQQYPERFIVINASQPLAHVQEQVSEQLMQRLIS